MSSVKRALIILAVLTLVIISGLYLFSQGRTYFNDDKEIGNTAGNIYNGGLFCEQGNTIYFSNSNDYGRLYSMTSYYTHINKVSNEKVVFINADGNYIYFIQAKDPTESSTKSYMPYENSGVYRINHYGKRIKAYTGKPSAYLMLRGNFLYFQNYNADAGFNLYRSKIDGTMSRILVKDKVIPTALIGNSIYYSGDTKKSNISSMNLSSYTSHIRYQGNYKYPIIFGDYIYYINKSDHNNIYRMKPNGSEPTRLVSRKCSTYNITESGKYLYYQIDESEKSKICRLNLETFISDTVKNGNYKQINVTQNYVFFQDTNDLHTYIIPADGGGNASTFNPKVKK